MGSEMCIRDSCVRYAAQQQCGYSTPGYLLLPVLSFPLFLRTTTCPDPPDLGLAGGREDHADVVARFLHLLLIFAHLFSSASHLRSSSTATTERNNRRSHDARSPTHCCRYCQEHVVWLKEKENQLAIHPVSKLLNTEKQILYRMPLHRTAGPKIVVMQLMLSEH